MKYYNLVLVLVVFFTIASCGKKKKIVSDNTNEEVLIPSLEKIWETDSLLTTCESVLYHKPSGLIYVSNVNNNPWKKDNNGFISTINKQGEIISHKWMEGFSGPKGMGVFNNKLYVTDIDRVVEIDIKTRKVLGSFPVEGEPRLNDITIDEKGQVYISGSRANTIYKLKNERLAIVAKDDSIRFNGLLAQKSALYFLNSSKGVFGVFDESTHQFKGLTSGVVGGDGIVSLNNGDFIISTWPGEVFYVHHKDWSKTLLLNTKNQKINSADIDFIEESNTLLVPTFFNNTVTAYKLHLN